MSLVSIADLLEEEPNRALIGLVCLGWEEVRAFVEAAESEGAPAILMVGPAARANMPLPVWGKMLQEAAKRAGIPLATHLDHGRDLEEVKIALESGFSSVMYDGSSLPLEENINNTAQMVELARKFGASTEGEIGFVGYAEGAESQGTDPHEAARFARETKIDLMAVSVGNVHLQTESRSKPDWARLGELAKIGTPLVIHGASGVAPDDRRKMAREFNVRKFNVGTEIRQVFGASLREALVRDEQVFDHIKIMQGVHAPLVDATRKVLQSLD